jgi:hypothetical protein
MSPSNHRRPIYAKHPYIPEIERKSSFVIFYPPLANIHPASAKRIINVQSPREPTRIRIPLRSGF